MTNEEIVKRAVEQYAEDVDADRENREAARKDLLMLTGEGQWPEAIRAEREAEGRPCLTINRLPQFVRQVTGDIRRVNPAIKVAPGDANTSSESADIVGGLIRQIEAASGADSIYESAAEAAAACGMGNFRILTEYADDESFDQDIIIKPIRNPFAVVWDRAAVEPTRKDAKHCFIVEMMKREDFKAQYKDADCAEWRSGETIETQRWFSGDDVAVAEYIWVETESETRARMADGSTVISPTKEQKAAAIAVRTVEKPVIMWAKISARDVLEGPQRLPGKHIPVLAVIGEELVIDQKRVRTSVIRYSGDSQISYNYMRSTQVEVIALQPKAPFLLTPDQIKGYAPMWAQANKSNLPYLVYNPDSKAAAAPQRLNPPVASTALMQEIRLADEEMKATTGIYDASLGARSNETSGVAIAERKVEGQRSTSIYVDNLALSIARCGEIIVSMIPEVYDTERTIRILGDDGAEQLQVINQAMVAPDGQQFQNNNLTVGRYTVRVATGPAYSTLKEEAANGMFEFLKAFPQAAPVIADMVAENMPWPKAQQIAERLRKLAPPGAIEEAPNSLTPEQIRQRQQQQEQAAQQNQRQEAAFRVEMAERTAKAEKTAAEAQKVGAETASISLDAARKQMELAVQNGLFDEVIRSEVARALHSATAPIGAF